MHVIAHFGAHGRFSQHLRSILNRNAQYLQNFNVHVPDRRRFGPLVRDALNEGDASPERRSEILKTLGIAGRAETVVFSNENYWSNSHLIIRNSELYENAEPRSAFFSSLFRGDRQTYLVSIENFPDFFASSRSSKLHQAVHLTGWEDIHEMSWYDLVIGLRRSAPDAEILVVASEAAPALMPRLFEIAAPRVHFSMLEAGYDYLRNQLHWRSRAPFAATLRTFGPGEGPDTLDLMEWLDRSGRLTVSDEAKRALGFDAQICDVLWERYRGDIARLRAACVDPEGDDAIFGLYRIPAAPVL